jgi:hypothetical protein
MAINRAIILIALLAALGRRAPARVQITATPDRYVISMERGHQLYYGERATRQVITADGDTSQTATVTKTTIGTLGAAAIASAATYLTTGGK